MGIKFALAAPATGSNAAFGEQLMKGAEAAANKINGIGGVNGEEIILVRGDDSAEPKQAVAVANRLVDQVKVFGVIGHFNSSCTIPASEVYDEAGVIAITAGATNPQVTERGLSAVFRMCGRDDQQGIVAGNFIVDALKGSKVALIHDRDTFGQGLADVVRAQLSKRGVKPVLYEGLVRGEKDFSSVVTKVRAAEVDVLFFGGVYPEAGPLVRQLREQCPDTAFVAADGIATDKLVSAAEGARYIDGVYMTFTPDPRLLPDAKAVVEEFRKAGTEPEGYTLHAYASVQALAAAFNGCKSNRGEDAARWLKANPVQTVLGKQKWDSKGDLVVADFVVHQWDSRGTYHSLSG